MSSKRRRKTTEQVRKWSSRLKKKNEGWTRMLSQVCCLGYGRVSLSIHFYILLVGLFITQSLEIQSYIFRQTPLRSLTFWLQIKFHPCEIHPYEIWRAECERGYLSAFFGLFLQICEMSKKDIFWNQKMSPSGIIHGRKDPMAIVAAPCC